MDTQGPNEHVARHERVARRLITASHRTETLAQARANRQGEGYGANPVPPPVLGAASASDTGFAPPPTALSPMGPAPTLAPVPPKALTPRSSDGSTMDISLYGRVLWRFKWVMLLGLVIGIGGAYMLYKGTGGGTYASRAQVFITQEGFTWGSNGQVTSSAPSSGGGTQQNTSTYVPGVDPQRLSALASVYAQLASGTALRQMLPDTYRALLAPPTGNPTATLSINAVPATEYSNPAILPIISFWAYAPSPTLAAGLAASASAAFGSLVTQQQAAVPTQSRVVSQVIQSASPAQPTGHKSKSLPIMVFLAGLLGAFGLSLALENSRPRSASSKRRRTLHRRTRGRTVGAEALDGTGSPADTRAEDPGFAESLSDRLT